MFSKIRLGFLFALVVGVIAGQHSHLSPVKVPTASAACFVGWGTCGIDTTRTSTLEVYHVTGASALDKVSPDSTDVWAVTAYYSPIPGLPCNDVTYLATVTVQNTGSGWSVSCVGCATAPFTRVGICDINSCSGTYPHAYAIKLDMTYAFATRDITKVNYTSTSIDDGDELTPVAAAFRLSPQPVRRGRQTMLPSNVTSIAQAIRQYRLRTTR